jgi:GDP-4-dehydro-6-deoxy-D-mannose reductase
MKCLITGVNGFVGSYLSEFLLGKNVNIIGTAYPDGANQNIHHILHKIKVFSCNLINPEGIDLIIKENTPDIIFHLAGQGNVPLSWQNPAGTFKINVLGTLHLLSAIKTHSPSSKILIIGSGDEYDFSSKKKPVNEGGMLMPKNPYALSKLCVDLLAYQMGKYHKLHMVRVRPFPHIGPRQTPNFVVSDFCRQVALIEKNRQRPVICTGNLNTERDFTDVRDMVEAYWLAVNKGKNGEVYNISSGNVLKIKEILKKILKLTKTKIRVETDQAKIRQDDTETKQGSSKKFRTLTGWKPKVPLERTLEETLNWWRMQINQHLA